jgi:uncharacterized spore protein YtfJ
MSAKELLRNLGETLGSTATVKAVFGEPIHIEGKTVVPVARVSYGFGGGFGMGPVKNDADHTPKGEGGGGGAAVKAYPVGALEITPAETRFLPFTETRMLAAVFAAGVLVGLLWRRKAS